jgi:hypothetical protein
VSAAYGGSAAHVEPAAAAPGSELVPAHRPPSQELVPQGRGAGDPIAQDLRAGDPSAQDLGAREAGALTPRDGAAVAAQSFSAGDDASAEAPPLDGSCVDLLDVTEEPFPAPRTAGLDELALLGLPAHLMPADDGMDLYPALVAHLRKLPKVPRTANRAGGVLAVVGPLSLALDVSRDVAVELGLSVDTAVFLAACARAPKGVTERQRIRDLAAAGARRAGWRRRRSLTVVAVDADLTAAGASQARAFLAALEPTATWGVVEATRKAHDIGAWTRALGGVHALAVTGVEETADPAAVLELGIPVSRLGGRAATPAVWASLLTGRLAA